MFDQISRSQFFGSTVGLITKSLENFGSITDQLPNLKISLFDQFIPVLKNHLNIDFLYIVSLKCLLNYVVNRKKLIFDANLYNFIDNSCRFGSCQNKFEKDRLSIKLKQISMGIIQTNLSTFIIELGSITNLSPICHQSMID